MRGVTNLSVDAKGRVAIPKANREQILAEGATRLVITVDPDGCLLIYPEPEWQLIEKKLMAMPNTDPRARKLQRLYVGHATDAEFDSAGRVRLTSRLLSHAAIERRVVLLGQGNKFELWSELRYEEQMTKWSDAAGSMDLNDLPEDLKTLSI